MLSALFAQEFQAVLIDAFRKVINALFQEETLPLVASCQDLARGGLRGYPGCRLVWSAASRAHLAVKWKRGILARRHVAV